MGDVVHARLDDETRRLLTRLRRRTGLSNSEIIRRALRALASMDVGPVGPLIVGAGEFESGQPDLGSNKDHLRGFGSR